MKLIRGGRTAASSARVRTIPFYFSELDQNPGRPGKNRGENRDGSWGDPVTIFSRSAKPGRLVSALASTGWPTCDGAGRRIIDVYRGVLLDAMRPWHPIEATIGDWAGLARVQGHGAAARPADGGSGWRLRFRGLVPKRPVALAGVACQILDVYQGVFIGVTLPWHPVGGARSDWGALVSVVARRGWRLGGSSFPKAL